MYTTDRKINAFAWQDVCNYTFMDWIEVLGLGSGICTASSMLPQLIKTIKEKKAEEISNLMLFILMTGVSGWIAYGVAKKDIPIMATNIFSMVLNIWMMILRIKYSNKK